MSVPASAQLEVIDVPVERIVKNPWNPNVQDRRTYEAERESIRMYGFMDPVTARPHPTLGGELVGEGGDGISDEFWQIIDGEHRWLGAQDEGIAVIPVVPMRSLTDAQAKKLTVILNETRGEADLVPLAQLLVSIQQQTDSIDELLMGLPYSERDLQEMLRVGEINWDSFEPARAKDIEDYLAGREAEPDLHHVTLALNEEQAERFATFTGTLTHEWQATLGEAVVRALSEAVDRVRSG